MVTALIRTGDELPADPLPGYEVAMTLLTELLAGADTPNAFVPAARHTGACRVCGQVTTLTFEHVPPRAAGNDQRARASLSLTMLTSDAPLVFPRAGWTPSQRGVGGYVLCEPCNNLVGTLYVPEYAGFATTLRARVNAAFTTAGHASGGLDLDLTGWALGDIARAGLVTVMDVAIHDRLLQRHPELTEVVRSPGTALPSTLRLGLTVVLGTRARLSSPMGLVDPDGCVVFSEAALAPFSWTLSFLEPGLRALPHSADVSGWLRHGADQRPAHTLLQLPVGAVVSAIPGDYRPAPDIEADLAGAPS